MTAAGQQSNGINRGSRLFFAALFSIVLALMLAGLSVFGFILASSPLALLSGSDRTLAAASLFVPQQNPLTLSLLTRPDRLIALQQSIAPPAQRQEFLAEVEQVKQSLLSASGIDYDRDIQPWLGEEVTLSFGQPTSVSTESGPSGDPIAPEPAEGYLLALEIAPERQQRAQEFLQLFWQQQSLAGKPPRSEQISGVRVLFNDSSRRVTALVGDRFVIFSNRLGLLRQSIRAAQTATNLAQNRHYREAVAQLAEPHVGFVYLDTSFLRESLGLQAALRPATPDNRQPSSSFAAIALGITRAGLTAHLRWPSIATKQPPSIVPPAAAGAGSALQFLPAGSAIALSGQNFSQLSALLQTLGIPADSLPSFSQLGSSPSVPKSPSPPFGQPRPAASVGQFAQPFGEAWAWATSDYALGRGASGRSDDWILALKRDPDGLSQLDKAAEAQGYSVIPVTLTNSIDNTAQSSPLNAAIEAERSAVATAWSRFRARRSRPSPGASQGLETELLGLHIQRGDYEIFASSLAALENALSSPPQSLLSSDRFRRAIASLQAADGKRSDNGHDTIPDCLYVDWPRTAPLLYRVFPPLKLISTAIGPFSRHLDTLIATQKGEVTRLSIQLRAEAVPAGTQRARGSTFPSA